MFRSTLRNWIILAGLVLLAPSLTVAKVSVMKTGPAYGLIGSDNSQPVSLNTERWIIALENIRYASETFFASGNPEPVFSEEQIHALTPQLRQALAGIRAGQALIFHEGKIRGEVFFSNGSLYWHFSRINSYPAFDLTEIAKENVMTSHAIETVPEDDIDVSYWSLLPQRGQFLYRGRPDMLAMPVSTLVPDTTRTLHAAKQTTFPAHTQGHPVAMASGKRPSAVSRINTLHRLLDKDLITKNEYNERLETIISEYENQYPSPEASLEFLKMLDKKGLIEPEMLQKHRKLVLDRL